MHASFEPLYECSLLFSRFAIPLNREIVRAARRSNAARVKKRWPKSDSLLFDVCVLWAYDDI